MMLMEGGGRGKKEKKEELTEQQEGRELHWKKSWGFFGVFFSYIWEGRGEQRKQGDFFSQHAWWHIKFREKLFFLRFL